MNLHLISSDIFGLWSIVLVNADLVFYIKHELKRICVFVIKNISLSQEHLTCKVNFNRSCHQNTIIKFKKKSFLHKYHSNDWPQFYILRYKLCDPFHILYICWQYLIWEMYYIYSVSIMHPYMYSLSQNSYYCQLSPYLLLF